MNKTGGNVRKKRSEKSTHLEERKIEKASCQALYSALQERPLYAFQNIYSALDNWRSCMHKLWDAPTPEWISWLLQRGFCICILMPAE